MTDVNIETDIPSDITTLEQLASWVALALNRCNPSRKVLENPDLSPQPVAYVGLIRADNNTNRLVVRLSLPIADNYPESGKKFWMNTLTFDDVELPLAFKSN